MKDALVKAEEVKKAGKETKPKTANLVLRVPAICKIETVAGQEVVDKAVTEARQYIADIPNHMEGLVSRIRKIRAALPEEQAIRSKELRVLEDEVLAHLNSGEELLVNAAQQAYALAMVSTLPPDKRVVMDTIKGNGNSRLPGLLGLKVLELVAVGNANAKSAVTVKVYGETYKVGGSRDFATKLAGNLSAGAAQAAKAAHEFYHGEVAAFKAQATISDVELLAKKPGQVSIPVPDVKDGEKFLPGGVLLVESDGRNIKVLKACGHFQRIMTEIAEAGAFVPIESLSRDRLELTKRLSEDAFRRVRILHAVLRRGIAEAQAETQ